MSAINPSPPGLLSRRVFAIDMGRVVVEEKWDIDEPGCPLIRSPWHAPIATGSIVIQQFVMGQEEFNACNIPLFG